MSITTIKPRLVHDGNTWYWSIRYWTGNQDPSDIEGRIVSTPTAALRDLRLFVAAIEQGGVDAIIRDLNLDQLEPGINE